MRSPTAEPFTCATRLLRRGGSCQLGPSSPFRDLGEDQDRPLARGGGGAAADGLGPALSIGVVPQKAREFLLRRAEFAH